LGQQSRSVTKNDLLLPVTCTTAPLSGHSVTTVKQIHKKRNLIVSKSVTMIVFTDSIDSNSSGWCFRVEEVSVCFRQSCDVLCKQRTAVLVTFIRQNYIRRTSSTCAGFFGTQSALALFNAVGCRELIDRLIELKDVVNKYNIYWCVIFV
jgi:hypothetical protein